MQEISKRTLKDIGERVILEISKVPLEIFLKEKIKSAKVSYRRVDIHEGVLDKIPGDIYMKKSKDIPEEIKGELSEETP